MTAPTHASFEVLVPAASCSLIGRLDLPPHATGLVLFAHGTGSSRASPRNRSVAAILNHAGLATLLFDLLSEPEALRRDNIFDIDLLASRLRAAVTWAAAYPDTSHLPIGLFGASTGAAAALAAAASEPVVRAVVSRGGRPDLAAELLHRVTAPTLLIVGGNDEDVLRRNEIAYSHLHGIKQLSVIAGATHLFEEPGTLDQVAHLASSWFTRHLPAEHAP